jgi:ketosteroid isomerase-like protein
VTDEEQIAASEHAIAAAHLGLDSSVIERLYHPKFVNVAPDGTRDGKAEMLASWRAGDRHWDVAEVSALDVRVTGGTGIVTGRWRSRGTNAGTRFDYAARFMSVWVREDGAWRNLAYHAVETEAP